MSIDLQQRMEGRFFTPKIWVDEGHKYITKVFGKDWKEKYIVWDPACGTGNLTKDYEFKELYCSTLLDEELEYMDDNKININATKFQYDFLNDDFDKLPEGIKDAIDNGKEIIIIMNPPYGASGTMTSKEGDHKAGIAKNNICDEMKKNKWSGSSQLYAQFFYRIWTWNKGNINIASYTNNLYKTGSSYKKFRSKFFTKFRYEKGFMFQASEFEGLSNLWAIDFSIWKSGIEDRDEYISDIKVRVDED